MTVPKMVDPDDNISATDAVAAASIPGEEMGNGQSSELFADDYLSRIVGMRDLLRNVLSFNNQNAGIGELVPEVSKHSPTVSGKATPPFVFFPRVF